MEICQTNEETLEAAITPMPLYYDYNNIIFPFKFEFFWKKCKSEYENKSTGSWSSYILRIN